MLFRAAAFLPFLLLLLLPFLLIPSTEADTPADCRFQDVVGVWNFLIGDTSADTAVNCSNNNNRPRPAENARKYVVKLVYPDVAVDEFGNDGFWTMVYNQGFEVVIAGRKFFAFSKFKQEGETVTSFCGETTTGWTHNVVGRNWGCFSARKATPVPPRNHSDLSQTPPKEVLLKAQSHFNSFFRSSLAASAGSAGSAAATFNSYEDLLRLAGGRKSLTSWRPASVEAPPEVKKVAASLPPTWDWRNVSGKDYVGSVRNQGGCGSCYAFASMGMLETRLRILTNDGLRLFLSPQDVVECSAYSQGCEGGFPYLVAGKYAEDFGAVPEQCNPYTGRDGKCSTSSSCPTRYFATRYHYVGGYYGGCSEEAMMISLVRDGPIAVAFEVTEAFMHYHGGIWRCDSSSRRSSLPASLRKFYPFELTNHAVLLVGYGEEEATGERFWIVKNSWGGSWGENGYFRIRRGTDECAIESTAVEAFPILS